MTIPNTMQAVRLIGYGDLDQLDFRDDVPVPRPAADEVLIQVGAAGINNTDINTRLGWYARSVDAATDSVDATIDDAEAKESAWSGQALQFPRIQGADVCGRIVATGTAVSNDRIGERVLVVPMQRSPVPEGELSAWTLGADGDGGYAQFVAVKAVEAVAINSQLTDAELASFPCAASTALNLIEQTAPKAGERVLVTGASGGVGSAAVQFAANAGAHVIAVASKNKHALLREIGAETLVDRHAPLLQQVDRDSVDVVIDVVAGDAFPDLLDALVRCGRYAVSGAIAGPIVTLDVRTLYLKDLTFYGRTLQEHALFVRLVRHIENGVIKPMIARTYALSDIHVAQTDFMQKDFVGKLVLIPEQPEMTT